MRGSQTRALAASFLSLFSIVGFALYGMPFFYDFFVRDLGWTRWQVTSGNALSKLVVGPVFGFAAGALIDRFGPRRLMMAGIVMAGAALIGFASVAGLAAFYAFYFFNALGYVCGGPLPVQVLLTRWFRDARGRAMGVAYLGIGVGGALVPLLAVALTQALGWRGALRVLGVLMIVVALPAAFLVREPPRLDDEARAGRAPSLAPALAQPAFWLLAFGSLASIGAIGGTTQNLKLYLGLDRHLAQQQIAVTLSLILVGSIVGRLLMGWLADRYPKKYVMLLIYAIVACVIPPLALAASPESIKLFAFLFGIGLGGDYMIIPLVAAELFDIRVMGRLLGLILTTDSIAEATVPLGVAMLRDRTGSYNAGFALIVALAAAGAVAVALLPRGAVPEARREDSGRQEGRKAGRQEFKEERQESRDGRQESSDERQSADVRGHKARI